MAVHHAHIEHVPEINTVDELKPYLIDMFIIHTLMRDAETYTEVFEQLYDVIKGCFTVKACREYPVHFKFYPEDTEVYTVQFRHFIINLMLWYPFVTLNMIRFMDESIIMDGTKIIEDPEYDLNDFINYRIIATLRAYNVKRSVVDEALSIMQYNLRRISLDFSDIMNLNFSFFTIWETYKKNPRVREIMECTFPDKSDPRAVEVAIDNMQKELIDIYKSDRSNPIGVILRSGTGIKHKQFGEMFVAQGYKPTIDGEVMTVPIETSTMIGGLRKPADLYIDASAARKSLVMNKTVMGKAGNFGKLVLQLVRTVELSPDVTDCDTKHYVPIQVRSKAHLKKLNNRFYRMDENDEFKLLDSKKDKDLIGKCIEMRSPATCALQNCICQKCYGKNAAINYDLAQGLPAFQSEEITKEVEQNILSTKHLLQTKSEVIEFNDAFYKYFTLHAGQVYPNITDNENIDDPTKLAIWIDPDSVDKVSDLDNDSNYNTYISTGTFWVENMVTHEREEVRLINEKEMFLSDTLIELWKNRKRKSGRYVLFSELDDDSSIVEMNIINDELTKPLYHMMKLLNNEKYACDNVADSVQRLLDILVEAGIKASSVAGECIINRLVRSEENMYERPDFSKENVEPYKMRTVAYCLKHNASPVIGLVTQYLRMQITSPEIQKRRGTSYMDPFMQIKVPNLYDIYGENGTLADVKL